MGYLVALTQAGGSENAARSRGQLGGLRGLSDYSPGALALIGAGIFGLIVLVVAKR